MPLGAVLFMLLLIIIPLVGFIFLFQFVEYSLHNVSPAAEFRQRLYLIWTAVWSSKYILFGVNLISPLRVRDRNYISPFVVHAHGGIILTARHNVL